jgi:hypothetical protein
MLALHELLLLSAIAVVSPPVDSYSPDTAGRSDTAIGVRRVYEYVAYPILQTATWPLQNVLAPAVEFLTYPAQPPIRYFLDENVIDRTTGLFRFGGGGNGSVYPTVSLASGTASRTGATMRHDSPFGRDTERFVLYFHYFVNGDHRARTFVTANQFLGTPLRAKAAFGYQRFENAPYYLPDVGTPYAHSRRSESYEGQLDAPLLREFYLRVGFALRDYRFGEAPPGLATSNVLTGDFFTRGDSIDGGWRGFNSSFRDRVWLAGVVRDTRNNENIPLDGSRLEAGWYYHEADGSRDFHEWRGRYTMHLKLGKGVYQLSEAEERALGGLSLERLLRNIEYDHVRRHWLSRKVLVLHLSAGRSYELPGNAMPFYGLQSLGNGTPLRAYPGSRYRHYAMAAATAEYRFPILRIMDGVIFNEYGAVGPSITDLGLNDNLRNSWGFGVRVRQPDMFLFRVELAFHGLSGAVINVNSETAF